MNGFGKVELFDAKLNGFVEVRKKLIESHHAERAIFWRATDEAMIAPQVAHGSRDLEPESIQMVELLGWIIESHWHKRASGG